MATYHVRPRPKGNPTEWAVEKRGASRASKVAGTSAGATAKAKDFADDGDTVVIHNADGSVRNRTTVDKADMRRTRNQARSGFLGL